MPQYSDSSTTRNQLTLYIPGIFDLPGGNQPSVGSLRALETLLVRSEQKISHATTGYENGLFSLFGIHADENSDLPVAAITRMNDMGVIDNDWWIRADPVNLSLDRERLVLIDAQRLGITQEQANRLVGEIMEVFKGDGWLLKAPCPDRWYLKPPKNHNITTSPLSQIIGQDVHPYLPKGPDSKVWHTTLNEIQIILHASNVNSEREQGGKLPVNSLWFWGGGRLPRITPAFWTKIWSNEPISLSLARMSEIPWGSPPGIFDIWLKHAGKPGKHLIILDDIQYVSKYEDAAGWNKILQGIEDNWMKPVLHALKYNTIASAELVTDMGMSFSLTSRDSRRWWRFRRPLETYGERRNG